MLYSLLRYLDIQQYPGVLVFIHWVLSLFMGKISNSNDQEGNQQNCGTSVSYLNILDQEKPEENPLGNMYFYFLSYGKKRTSGN